MDKKQVQQAAGTAANVTVAAVGGLARTAIKIIATVLLVILTTGLLFTCVFAYYVKTNLSEDLGVTLEDMTLNLASNIYYTDTDGQIKELANLHGVENRIWVDLENIPESVQMAAIAIEDKRFLEHNGVDWYRTAAAFVNMFATMKDDFGGSTITQQLIKNLTLEDDITVQRKLQEIFRALDFERMYTKDEIMEWYLNVIFFGQGCNGVGTASQMYFGKDVWDLSIAESASLIGITNNPSKYDPYISRKNNEERQQTILFEMYDQGLITKSEYDAAIAEVLVFKRAENEEAEVVINSYFVDAVIEEVIGDLMEAKGVSRGIAANILYNGGLQIYASMNPAYQQILDDLYLNRANFPSSTSQNGEQIQSAAILMDPYTGEILALRGGIGEKTESLGFCRATIAQRPPGSAIKPLAAYGPAVDQNLISPSTLVNDSPNVVLSSRSDGWLSRNAGGGYSGIITIQTALTNSINTVSCQIIDKLGVDQSYKYLTERLGFTSLVDADRDFAPLALGQITNGVTVREMAQGYTAFVNDGIFTYARTYTHITDTNGQTVLENGPDTIVAFKANTAWVMTYMLNIAATYGTGSESSLGGMMPHAGKTGSSDGWKDRWFVGYTPYYLCAVWTGYDTPAFIGSGSNPSARIWRSIMLSVHQGLEYRNFKSPTSLGGPTNIFGDLSPASEEPEESEEVSESPTESPSPSPGESPTSSVPPTASAPVTSSPTVPVSPTPTPSPTIPPPPSSMPSTSPLPDFEPYSVQR